MKLRKSLEEYYIPVTETGCWIWLGCTTSTGYGQLLWKPWTTPQRAHRIFYELLKGPIPDGYQICHKCDIPLCVNPDHLYAGTQSSNMKDRSNRGRNPKGMKSARRKLTIDEVHKIRSSRESQWYLAKIYGVNQSTISRVINRETW